MEFNKFGIYRVAACSPELKVANPMFNADEICKIISKDDAALYVFPELCITGYSCQDLFFQKSLMDATVLAINTIVELSNKLNSIIIIGAPVYSYNRLYNAALIISDGSILGVVPKTYLCNSNEYYEERWFASSFERFSDNIQIGEYNCPFGEDLIFENICDSKFKFGVEICEDMWAPIPPAANLVLNGAVVIANLSASNEYLGKSSYRENNLKMHSGRLLSANIYAASGLNESTSDTVFSGKSMIFENAEKLASTKPLSFKSEVCYADIDLEKLINERIKNNTFSGSRPQKKCRIIYFDLENRQYNWLLRKLSPTPFVPDDISLRNSVCSEIIELQVSALSRRLKHINMQNVVIGISGGLDSTLALLVTYNTFQKLNLNLSGIIAVTMPGFGTTDRTKTNAQKLCEMLGITLLEIPINDSVRLHFQDIGHDETNKNVVYENAQARRRTHILMDLANKYNGIVIGTGDLSESALGWCTFNGDHISMYGINSGVPKTLVKYLVEWFSTEIFNNEVSSVLTDIINTPISPELLPPDLNDKIIQETEIAIGPYLLHDFFLYYTVRHNFNKEKILYFAEIAFENKFTKEYIQNTLHIFYKRFFNNQFKRNAVPDGPKIGTVALSPRADWRMPSDANYEAWIKE